MKHRQAIVNMERVRNELSREGRQNCKESGSMFEQQRTKYNTIRVITDSVLQVCQAQSSQ